MTIQRWLLGLVVAGAFAGILLFFVAGSTGWGPPGSSEYAEYERGNRIVAIPWLVTLIGLIGLLITDIRFKPGLWRAATVVLAISGTILVLGGNVAEFWLYTDRPSQDEGRANAWAAFLAGHLFLLVAAIGFVVGTWRPR